MHQAVIAATGLFTPPHAVSNAELVGAFNAWVERFNADHADAIAAGRVEPRQPSSVEFVEKASGIRSRYVMDKAGVIDPQVMRPRLPARPDEELSLMAEMGVAAARDAIARWGKPAERLDAVLCAASNMQRPYPAMAVEIQQALGVEGFGFDMNVACSSATFGIKTAADYVATGSARAVLVVNPEICSAHLNFRDRDSHFIFGDVATAVIVERAEDAEDGWEILGTRLKTQFSNNIRNNFGFLNRTEEPVPASSSEAVGERKASSSEAVGAQKASSSEAVGAQKASSSEAVGEREDKLFVQQGRKVFKEVVPMVSEMILDHARELDIAPERLKRLWLHQANINMNELIGRRVLGREPAPDENVIILDEYANTSSAGSIIAFHKHSDDLAPGDLGLICSFGAGYSAGTVFVRRR